MPPNTPYLLLQTAHFLKLSLLFVMHASYGDRVMQRDHVSMQPYMSSHMFQGQMSSRQVIFLLCFFSLYMSANVTLAGGTDSKCTSWVEVRDLRQNLKRFCLE